MRVSNDMDLVGDDTDTVILSSDQTGCAMSCSSKVTCTAASFHKTSRTCKLTRKDPSKPGTMYSASGFVLMEKGNQKHNYLNIDCLRSRLNTLCVSDEHVFEKRLSLSSSIFKPSLPSSSPSSISSLLS